jgi:hypothetical protein
LQADRVRAPETAAVKYSPPLIVFETTETGIRCREGVDDARLGIGFGLYLQREIRHFGYPVAWINRELARMSDDTVRRIGFLAGVLPRAPVRHVQRTGAVKRPGE